MNLFRTSFLSGLAVLTKLATSVFLNKMLAIYVGPSGYGVIGQLQSLIAISTTFASGAVNTGVTKYTAEYANDQQRQQSIWATAGTLGMICTGIPALVFILARRPLSRWLLGSTEHSHVLVWLAFALPFLVLNGLLLAILNGRKEAPTFVAANIGGNLIGAAVASALVMAGGLSGALIALATGQAAACGWTVWLSRRTLQLRWCDLCSRFDRGTARLLGGYALMAGTSAVVVPLSHMIIRDRLVSLLGWEGAGMWQALLKISETHLLLLTSTLSVYFLPRFSEIRSGNELRHEVFKGYRFVIPVVIASAAILYLLRRPLIGVLLSEKFLPLVDVLGLQLIGDVLKITSWVMAFTMVSHAQTRVFVATELVFSGLLVTLTLALVPLFGLLGASAAYVLTYAAYSVAMYFYFGRLVARLKDAS